MEKAYVPNNINNTREKAPKARPKIALPQLELFQNAVAEIKERFFVVEEFPHLPRERFPQGVLEQVLAWPPRELAARASSLKSRELEGLLWDLTGELAPEEIAAGVQVFTLRASNRLSKLFNQLWQYHYQKPGVRALALALGEAAQKNGWDSGSLLARLFQSEHQDPVLVINEALAECDHSIAALNKQYQLQSDSPLALAAYHHFLKDAPAPILKLNKIYLALLIREAAPESLEPLIVNYMQLFDIDTYEQAVNLAIEKRLGQPYTSSSWQDYDEKLKKKFALWCFWYQLFKHFIHQPKKMKALSPYIGLIRSAERLAGQEALVIDFGDLVAVDIADEPYSLFYQDKEMFHKEMAAWEEEDVLPQFARRIKIPVTARDYIIELKEAPCIVLDYESVNLFYIKEMLDIKMALEPDMRQLKLFRR